MSYSFGVRGESKAAVKALVAEKFAEVVASQPSHAVDQAQALAAADAFIDLLVDDAESDVTVSMSGSLWTASDGVRASGVNVNAGTISRK